MGVEFISRYRVAWAGPAFLDQDYDLLALLPRTFSQLLSIPLIALPWAITDKRIRLLLGVIAFGIAGLELEVWSQPHYAAPLTGAVFAVLLQCMRHLQFWRWRGKPVGRFLVRSVVIACFAFDVAWLSAVAMHVNDFTRWETCNAPPFLNA